MKLAAAGGGGAPSGLIMAVSSYVFTIGRVAKMLDEAEPWLQMIADDMEPEDGCLTVCDADDLGTTAFTPFGIESLKEVIAIYRHDARKGWARHPTPPRCSPDEYVI